MPTASDDVVISGGAGTEVVISSGSLTVKSLQCTKAFTISGGSFMVTDGSSILQGDFTLAGGAMLAAKGPSVILAAQGTTTIRGNLQVDQAATLLLTNLTSLVVSNASMQFSVGGWYGGGGVVDLSGVTNVVVVAPYQLQVSASTGGRVDLRRARIVGNYFQAYAGGAGSVVDLSGLSGQWGMDADARLETGSGGTLLIPNVTALARVNLILSGTNGTPTGQLTNIDGCWVTLAGGATLNLSKVTSVAGFRGAQVDQAATLLLTNLTSLVVSNASMQFSVVTGRKLLFSDAEEAGAGGAQAMSGRFFTPRLPNRRDSPARSTPRLSDWV